MCYQTMYLPPKRDFSHSNNFAEYIELCHSLGNPFLPEKFQCDLTSIFGEAIVESHCVAECGWTVNLFGR